jgi:Tfp pilus assembly protein PilE
MARGLGLLLLLAPLVVAGVLLNAELSPAPAGGSAARQIERARQTADAAKLQQAAFAIEQFHALNGTYAAASLGHLGVRLVRADAGSYCLETAHAHLAGPGGSAQPGRC